MRQNGFFAKHKDNAGNIGEPQRTASVPLLITAVLPTFFPDLQGRVKEAAEELEGGERKEGELGDLIDRSPSW